LLLSVINRQIRSQNKDLCKYFSVLQENQPRADLRWIFQSGFTMISFKYLDLLLALL